MHFASGSVIDLASDDTTPSSLKIDSGSAALGSLVILDANVDLKTSGKATSGSYLTIQGVNAANSPEKYSELRSDADVIGKYLTTGQKADVVLKQDAKLVLEGKKVVLGSATANAAEALTLKIASGAGTEKATGVVIVSGTNSIVHADNFEIAAQAGNGSNLASNLTLSANDMTLGKAGFTQAIGAKLQAKNVTFVESATNTPFALQDSLTLSNVSGTGTHATAQKGNISGDVTVSGTGATFAVNGGIYSANGIKLDKGSLSVGSAKSLASSNLSISKLTIDNSNAANTITVEGAENKGATLDLTNTEFDLTGNNSNLTTINVKKFKL